MHPEITAAVTGQCPICKMAFVAGNPLDTREYELDFTTSPAAVRAGTPFTITLTVKDGDEAITKFEEVHDKRYHLFIISRDMTVFEHVHPVLQPAGAWELEATLPKPGYYNIVSDFLPTGGAPQVITRALITADYNGDALSDQVKIQPDTIFEKTLNGITARVDFDPKPLQAGEHGHLTYNLTDATTGQPVADLQPYLGAFGHTLIMSEDQANVVHSHPTPDISNDISRGAGRPASDVRGILPDRRANTACGRSSSGTIRSRRSRSRSACRRSRKPTDDVRQCDGARVRECARIRVDPGSRVRNPGVDRVAR